MYVQYIGCSMGDSDSKMKILSKEQKSNSIARVVLANAYLFANILMSFRQRRSECRIFRICAETTQRREQ